MDFDEVAKREIFAMNDHFDEIKDIDYSNHSFSFYSTSTTMKGIKTVCELTKNSQLHENVTIIDIIKLLNIAGIGCEPPIGNYTDPMTYRLNDLYLRCYVSLSDVLGSSEYSNGRNNLEDFMVR